MNCPICLSEKNSQVYEKLLHGISSDSNYVDGEISNLICVDCGHVFNESGARYKTASFYSESYRLMDLSPESEFKFYTGQDSISYSDWRLNSLIENFSIPSSGKILDIGCGKGNFLHRFSKKYPKWLIYGIEGSKNALKFAKEKLPNAKFFEGFFTKDPFGEKFDVIVSLGVLEHLEDPNIFLQQAITCLKDNGIFLFDIPNFKLNPADLFVFDHLNHFTKETLQNLLQKNNLEILELIENTDRVPLFVLCKKTKKIKELKNHFNLLKKITQSHIEFNETLINTYENTSKKYGKVCVFGLGIMIWAGIQNKKIKKENIISFFDENDYLIGKEKHGTKIRSINEIPQYKDYPLVFSLSPCYMEKVSEKIKKIGANYILPKNYDYYKKYL